MGSRRTSLFSQLSPSIPSKESPKTSENPSNIENTFENFDDNLDISTGMDFNFDTFADFEFSADNAQQIDTNTNSQRERLFSVPSDDEKSARPAEQTFQPDMSAFNPTDALGSTNDFQDMDFNDAWLADFIPDNDVSNNPQPSIEPQALLSVPGSSAAAPSYPNPTAYKQNIDLSMYGDFSNYAPIATPIAQPMFAPYYAGPSTTDPSMFTNPLQNHGCAFQSYHEPLPTFTGEPMAASEQQDGPRRPSNRSNNSVEYTTALPGTEYQPERPKFDPDHPWVRTNAVTQGLTKRCGKINTYDSSKMYKRFPNAFGPWRSPKHTFTYNRYGELAEQEYSIDEIREFIYHHPITNGNKLRLWIQKTPADSARRYPTATLSKCRFRDCPARQGLKAGTMLSGHNRVAFDETSFKHGSKADPFHTAAFVHLYCFEKFLDLPEICTLRNIEIAADLRHLENEPNQKYAASISGSKDGIVAQRFIESASRGGPMIRDFEFYPRPSLVPGVTKEYKHMLNYRMNYVKENSRTAACKRLLESRGLKDTHITKNLGNLDLFVKAKLAMRKPKPPPKLSKKLGKKRKAPETADENSDGESENESGDSRPRRGGKHRKTRRDAFDSESEEEYQSSDSNNSPPRLPRMSPSGAKNRLSPIPSIIPIETINDAASIAHGTPQYAWLAGDMPTYTTPAIPTAPMLNTAVGTIYNTNPSTLPFSDNFTLAQPPARQSKKRQRTPSVLTISDDADALFVTPTNKRQRTSFPEPTQPQSPSSHAYNTRSRTASLVGPTNIAAAQHHRRSTSLSNSPPRRSSRFSSITSTTSIDSPNSLFGL